MKIADDRSINDNEQRWPHYEAAARLMLSMIAVAEARPAGKRAEGRRTPPHARRRLEPDGRFPDPRASVRAA